MKHILVLTTTLFSLLAAPIDAFSQWENISPTNANQIILFDVEFANDNLGFAVGQDLSDKSGVIFKTADGGGSWTKNSFPNHHLRSIAILSEKDILVTGYDGPPGQEVKWITSSDSGETWSSMADNRFTGMNGLQFIDGDVGFSFGYGSSFGFTGGLMRTTDGGKNWTTQFEKSSFLLESVSFINMDFGFMVGVSMMGDGTIYKTTDGGKTFSQLYTGSWMSNVQFLNKDLGYVVDGLISKQLLKTTDGGSNWNGLSLNDEVKILAFLTEDFGYCLGDESTIVKTEDGGQSWTDESLGLTEDINGYGLTHKYIYICGDHGIVYKSVHNKFTSVHGVSKTVQDRVLLYPNPGSTSENLTISGLSDKNYSFELFTMQGQRLLQTKVINNKVNLGSSLLQSGTYFYVILGDEERITGKLILE